MKTLKITLLATLIGLSFAQCSKVKRCKGEVCTHELGANETEGDVVQLEGDYKLTYKMLAKGGEFSNGDVADFYISDKNQMVVAVGGSCVILEVPYKLSFSEVVFEDECEFYCSFITKRSGTELVEVAVLNSLGETVGVFK